MEYFGLWFIMAIVCAMIAAKKGRSAVGFFFYGLIMWPIALVHALLLEKTAETALLQFVRKEARVCPHCRRDLPEDWTLQAIERLRAQER